MRNILKRCTFLAVLGFFFTLALIQPVAAANNTLTIGYSGSGGSYIGDMIFFSGKGTAGSSLLMKIAGPGLPPEGVPVYNLNGDPGTGTPIEVGQDGIWKFLWYISSTSGVEKLQTARYSITVEDSTRSNLSASTSVFLKKPEFYFSARPSPAGYGDYVVITGNAERGVDYVRIDVLDGSGKIYRTFSAPVGADGYFNYGFHADMPPGSYFIRVGNPSMQTSLRIAFDLLPPVNSSSATVETTPQVLPPATLTEAVTPVPSPTRNRLPLPPMLALCGILGGAFVVVWSRRTRK